MDELIDWMLEKHKRMVMVIPVASDDPWTMHGSENVCVGCLPTFVSTYLEDVPEVMEQFLAGTREGDLDG